MMPFKEAALTHSYRVESKTTRPVMLSIAGSDSAGLAGVQMDVRTGQALQVHTATAITANTAQHAAQVLSVNPVSGPVLAEQIEAALTLQPQAIKIGLLANCEQVDVLVALLTDSKVPLIYDPVLAASSGKVFTNAATLVAIKNRLLPLCRLVTPNVLEAEQLSGIEILSDDDRIEAAQRIAGYAAPCVIIKGGHVAGDDCADYCYSEEDAFWISHARVMTLHTRGTGCAFSSAIAAACARGYAVRDAVVIAKMALQQGLLAASACNESNGSVTVTRFPFTHWPQLRVVKTQKAMVVPFASCVGDGYAEKLGLYPVVDRAHWLERLLPLGITTIQLRVKDLHGSALKKEVTAAIALATRFGARLFVNDYWQLAAELGAYGVHLGQEDLDSADLDTVRRAGLRLGISSHCHFEVARAITLRPSYIACGPTFATTTKQMPWVPHGIEGLQYWQRALDYPLVAIGGITAGNIAQVADTGVSGIALITAITLAQDPEATVRQLLSLMQAPALASAAQQASG